MKGGKTWHTRSNILLRHIYIYIYMHENKVITDIRLFFYGKTVGDIVNYLSSNI